MDKQSKYKSIKGTRDFYPEIKYIHSWLYENIKSVSQLFGYEEYEAPYLETVELYASKSGDELVKEQSFVFPDRSGNLIALRPELTPSLARMVSQRQRQLTFPIRWWSFGPFWRYERPQKGRSREFFQWNIDMIGVDSVAADAELIAVLASFFKSVGLSNSQVCIYLNNRRLMESEINKLDFPNNSLESIIKLIDRKPKISHTRWVEGLEALNTSPSQINTLEGLLANKELWKYSIELSELMEHLSSLNVIDYTEFKSDIVRGLDYYTGNVFEAHSLVPEFRRAIAGGGRYDDLLQSVGGNKLPGVGFAMGDVVITLLLEHLGAIPSHSQFPPATVLVSIFNEETLNYSSEIATLLRANGIKTILYPKLDKLGKQFKYANKLGLPHVIIAGPDEIVSDRVSIKNLSSGEQITISRQELIPTIQGLID